MPLRCPDGQCPVGGVTGSLVWVAASPAAEGRSDDGIAECTTAYWGCRSPESDGTAYDRSSVNRYSGGRRPGDAGSAWGPVAGVHTGESVRSEHSFSRGSTRAGARPDRTGGSTSVRPARSRELWCDAGVVWTSRSTGGPDTGGPRGGPGAGELWGPSSLAYSSRRPDPGGHDHPSIGTSPRELWRQSGAPEPGGRAGGWGANQSDRRPGPPELCRQSGAPEPGGESTPRRDDGAAGQSRSGRLQSGVQSAGAIATGAARGGLQSFGGGRPRAGYYDGQPRSSPGRPDSGRPGSSGSRFVRRALGALSATALPAGGPASGGPRADWRRYDDQSVDRRPHPAGPATEPLTAGFGFTRDRKSTRLNSSHGHI